MAESRDNKISRNGDDLEGRHAVLASSKDSVEEGGGGGGGIPECAVCLQSCVHPCRLPCGHVFCFLCIKGTVATAYPGSVRRCAMCRREIPPDFLDKPVLLCPVFPISTLPRAEATTPSCTPSEPESEAYLWFYEGRNGWWQYDERTRSELEGAYKRGERSCELLVAGFLYVADFDGMVQLRRGDPSRRRRIKRDLASIPVKGVAGLRARPPSSQQQPPPPPAPPAPGQCEVGGGAGAAAAAGGEAVGRLVEDMARLQLSAAAAAAAGCVAAEGGGGREGGGAGSGGAVLWSPVSPDAAASPWVLTLSSDEDQL